MQENRKKTVNGLLLALGLGVVALLIAPILGKLAGALSPVAEKAISNPLLVAIVIGLILGNIWYDKVRSQYSIGIDLAKKQVLRIAIVFYGFRLTFSELVEVGMAALFVDVVIVFGTFFLAVWLGKHCFKVDSQTSMLIGAGASICGAAAVLAAEPVVKAPAHKVSVALATVVLFGTVSMFLYPVIYSLGIFAFSGSEFGVYIGSTVHEVAQVAAAGGVISIDVMNTAVITKMARVILLAPFLLMLTYLLRKQVTEGESKGKITVPWFALGFIVVIGLHSFPIWSKALVSVIIWLDTLMLCMAMAALGLTTHFGDMRKVGVAPFKLAGAIWLWLVFGGALLNGVVNIAIFFIYE